MRQTDPKLLAKSIEGYFMEFPSAELDSLTLIQKMGVSTTLTVLNQALQSLIDRRILRREVRNGVRLYQLA